MEVQNQSLAPTIARSYIQATTQTSNLSSASYSWESGSFDSGGLNLVSACRFCHHFDSTGRRGGECSKLQSHVEGDWASCSLAMPTFAGDSMEQSSAQLDIYSEVGDRFSPSLLPKLLPSMSPSMANILVNSAPAILAR
jgi:hypothetical protein